MDSPSRWWADFRSRSPRFQGIVILVTALALGLVLALVAGTGGGSGLDQGAPDERAAGDPGSEEADAPGSAEEREPEPVLVVPNESEEEGQELELVERDLGQTIARVRSAFQRRIVPRARVGGLRPAILSARCTPAGVCRVVYRADGAGVGKAIEDQGPIWQEFFANPRVRAAVLIVDVGGPDVKGEGSARIDRHDHRPSHAGRRPLIVRCDRAAMERVRRVGVDGADDVKRLCKVDAEDHPGI